MVAGALITLVWPAPQAHTQTCPKGLPSQQNGLVGKSELQLTCPGCMLRGYLSNGRTSILESYNG